MTAPRLLLGHGASGNAASMQPYAAALTKLGIDAAAVDLPRGNTERAMSAFLAAAGPSLPEVAIGGHSFGGRVASLIAAEHDVAALVLLSYPLHRPGKPDELRTEHWSRIRCPVLLLSGESDPFARSDLLRREVRQLRNAELVMYEGLGHGVLPALADVAPRMAAFLERIAAPD